MLVSETSAMYPRFLGVSHAAAFPMSFSIVSLSIPLRYPSKKPIFNLRSRARDPRGSASRAEFTAAQNRRLTARLGAAACSIGTCHLRHQNAL